MPTTNQQPLRRAAVLFTLAFVLHNADHARRGIAAVTEHVIWGGTGVAMLSAAMLTTIALRHPVAPAVAMAAGFSIALGVSATHLLPDWGVFSDSLPSGDVDVFTWVAVLGEVAGAVLVGVTGLRLSRPNEVVASAH